MTRTAIEDLGPANDSMFPVMSGLQVGDVVYIGSRNLTPSRVLAYDLGTRRVTACYELGPGKFVQALASGPDHRVYAGIVGAGPREPNVFVIDPSAHQPVCASARVSDLFVRALAVAADSTVYAVGRQQRPALWELRPETGKTRCLAAPAPAATQACGVAVSGDAVYYGSGSDLAGGPGASRCGLFRVDRATGAVRDILPPALAGDAGVSELALAGDRLLVGTYGRASTTHLAVVPLAGGEPTITGLPGKFIRNFHVEDERVYFGARDVCCYDRRTQEVTTVHRSGHVERWGLGRYGRELISVSSMGGVDHLDLDTGQAGYVDLLDAGAPRDLQLGMSLAVDATDLNDTGTVYVGGNSGVVVHRLDGGAPARTERLLIPGEAKSMDVIDGELWMAVYNSQGLWRYRPGGRPENVAQLPVEQNRPQDTAWDPARGLWLIGTQNDIEGGGALAAYWPQSQALTVHRNPLGPFQMVRAVTVVGDACCLGGWSRSPACPSGEVACLDADTLTREAGPTVRWRVDPGLEAGISTLTALGDAVLGAGVNGVVFALDATTGTVRARREIPELRGRVSRMITVGDRAYLQTADATVALDAGLDYRIVADGLDGKWYSGPKIAADAHGRLYTLRGRRLVRLTPDPGRERNGDDERTGR